MFLRIFKHKTGKRFMHQREYMDQNCPIIKMVDKSSQLTKHTKLPMCSLYLHDECDEGNSARAFGGAIGCYPPVNEEQKDLVGKFYNTWKNLPVKKHSDKFFDGDFKSLNSVSIKKNRN